MQPRSEPRRAHTRTTGLRFGSEPGRGVAVLAVLTRGDKPSREVTISGAPRVPGYSGRLATGLGTGIWITENLAVTIDHLLHDLATTSELALFHRVASLAREQRRLNVYLVAALAEVETRSLHLGAGYPGLWEYCRSLGLSKGEAWRRIQAARLVRKFLEVLEDLAQGRWHLSGVSSLAKVMTAENESITEPSVLTETCAPRAAPRHLPPTMISRNHREALGRCVALKVALQPKRPPNEADCSDHDGPKGRRGRCSRAVSHGVRTRGPPASGGGRDTSSCKPTIDWTPAVGIA